MNDQVAVYDGNTLAGPLSEVFAVELTTAAGRCRSCGTTSDLATFRVYGPDPALWDVVRIVRMCCLRLVRTPEALWLTSVGCPPCGSRCHPTLPQRPTNRLTSFRRPERTGAVTRGPAGSAVEPDSGSGSRRDLGRVAARSGFRRRAIAPGAETGPNLRAGTARAAVRRLAARHCRADRR